MSGNRESAKNTSNGKRLLVLCPKGSLDSGGVISNFQLIQYLVEKGYRIKVITSWEGDYNTTLTKLGIENRTVPYNWWAPRDTPKDISRRVITAVASIVSEIDEFKPHVVITNTSHIPWGAWAASMTNTPHIWTVREYPIKNFEYLADKVRFIKQYSNKIMANSSELAKYYKKNYECSSGQFISYVDTKELKLDNKIKEVRLISPNYMSVGKNQIELIQAVGILRSRRKDLTLRVLLMGEKEKTYAPKLEAALKKFKVADIVEVYERVSDPWSKVGKNDILVQTSLSESIGRTTTEAMKLGVPVIASDIPGHREAFSLGGGTLYRLGSPEDLADKIEYALDHPQEIAKKANDAQKKALVNMSSEASNGPFAKAIEDAIGNGNLVGSNAQIWPYLKQYIQEMEQLVQEQIKELSKKNDDTDLLLTALEEIRNSRSYKLGRMQTSLISRVGRKLKKGLKRYE